MAFILINRSPQNVRQIPGGYTTRRTSIDNFNENIETILDVVQNLAINDEQPVPRAELLRLVTDSRFAFSRLRQRAQPRRFPATYAQLWAYLGLPIQAVSFDLAVSVSLLKRRIEEQGIRWPNGSDAERLLLAVQFADQNHVLNRRFLRVRRGLPLAHVHQILRHVFEVDLGHGEVAVTQFHVESQGKRYGPLLTDAQWQEVVGHVENFHRINIFLLVGQEVVGQEVLV